MDLGLQSLIDSGRSPGEAAATAQRTAEHPAVQEMLRDLASSEDGWEVLEDGRQIWAHYGLIEQWEEVLRAAGIARQGS